MPQRAATHHTRLGHWVRIGNCPRGNVYGQIIAIHSDGDTATIAWSLRSRLTLSLSDPTVDVYPTLADAFAAYTTRFASA